MEGCLGNSDYEVPAGPIWDPQEELAQKKEWAEAGIAWATCARSAGVQGVKDPAPPRADQWKTEPRALLPVTIGPDSLRALLSACPRYDPEGYAEEQRTIEAGEGETVTPAATPVIGFDVVGWDGKGGTPDDAPEELRERLWDLFGIIIESGPQG
jgi:hypothetical protein